MYQQLAINTSLFNTEFSLTESGRYILPLSIGDFDSGGLDKNVIYPSRFIIPFESGQAMMIPLTQPDVYRVRLIETWEGGQRYDISVGYEPASFWNDGSIKILHAYANVRWVADVPLTYHLEWFNPTPVAWYSGVEAYTGCADIDCDGGIDPFLFCDDVGGGIGQWQFLAFCENPCCVPNITLEQIALIGTPCEPLFSGIALGPCINVTGGYTVYNNNLDNNIQTLATGSANNELFGVVDKYGNTSVLPYRYPTINSGILYIKDVNGNVYYPQDTAWDVVSNDKYRIVILTTGRFMNGDRPLASYRTSIEHTYDSYIYSFNHHTSFEYGVEYNTEVIGNTGVTTVTSGLPIIQEHCFLFPGFTGQVLTRNIEAMAPYSVTFDGSDTKVNLWPSGLTDTNATQDYSANNAYKMAYLHKGSGVSGLLNFDLPSGYLTYLNGIGEYPGITGYQNISMGIDFALNLGPSSVILQYAYDQNVSHSRDMKNVAHTSIFGKLGTYSGEYQHIDDVINNSLLGYYVNTNTRHGVSGWNMAGYSHGRETPTNTGLVLPDASINNAHNTIALAWTQGYATSHTGVLQAARNATKHMLHVRSNQIDMIASPTSTLGIGNFQNISAYNNWDIQLYSWLLDGDYLSLLSYNHFIESMSAFALALENERFCGSGAPACSGQMRCEESQVFGITEPCSPCYSELVMDTGLFTLIGTPCDPTGIDPALGYNADIEWRYVESTPFTRYGHAYSGMYNVMFYQLLLANQFTFKENIGVWIQNTIDAFTYYNPSGLVNAQSAGYRDDQLMAPLWMSKYYEVYQDNSTVSVLRYFTEVPTPRDYLIMSANNLMSGTLNGVLPLALMASAYDITQDDAYLRRYMGVVNQIPYTMYSGSNSDWQYYAPHLPERTTNYLAGWPVFKRALQDAGITMADIPIETGAYLNGDTTGTLTTEITNYGAKIYVYNTGVAPIVAPTLNTGKLGKITTDSSLYVRTQSGTVTSGLNLGFLTHSNPTALVTDLRPSTWEYYVEPTSGNIPTGISQLVLGGNVSIYRPITQYPEASIIPQYDSINGRRRLQVSVCSGVIYPYSGPMSGTFTCTHHQNGYNTAPAFISIGGTGTWLLPEESVSYVWGGPTTLVVNCQDSSNILARFSGQEAVVGTNNIGLFGDLDHINILLPLVTGLSY